MTVQEIREQLKVNDYGEMVLLNKVGKQLTCTGTIIFITKKGTVTFYDNEKIEYFKKPEEIISFQHKEMLPPPKEHADRPITYDSGRWIYTGSGKEVKLDR